VAKAEGDFKKRREILNKKYSTANKGIIYLYTIEFIFILNLTNSW